jgi:hypothetical protein
VCLTTECMFGILDHIRASVAPPIAMSASKLLAKILTRGTGYD